MIWNHGTGLDRMYRAIFAHFVDVFHLCGRWKKNDEILCVKLLPLHNCVDYKLVSNSTWFTSTDFTNPMLLNCFAQKSFLFIYYVFSDTITIRHSLFYTFLRLIQPSTILRRANFLHITLFPSFHCNAAWMRWGFCALSKYCFYYWFVSDIAHLLTSIYCRILMIATIPFESFLHLNQSTGGQLHGESCLRINKFNSLTILLKMCRHDRIFIRLYCLNLLRIFGLIFRQRKYQLNSIVCAHLHIRVSIAHWKL